MLSGSGTYHGEYACGTFLILHKFSPFVIVFFLSWTVRISAYLHLFKNIHLFGDSSLCCFLSCFSYTVSFFSYFVSLRFAVTASQSSHGPANIHTNLIFICAINQSKFSGFLQRLMLESTRFLLHSMLSVFKKNERNETVRRLRIVLCYNSDSFCLHAWNS